MPTKQTKVTLDFETRSYLTPKKNGAWKYSLDPSTDVMCVCFCVGDGGVWASRGPAFGESKRVLPLLEELAANEDVIFEAHNANFEYAIWHNIMHKRHGFSDIPPERWRCSASVAAYKAMPRALGDLAKALDTKHKKDEEGKRVMMKMSKPVLEKFRHLHGEWYEDEEDWKVLISYCKDDVRTEHACSEILGELPPPELKLWLLDFKINHTGIRVDMEFIKAARQMKEKIKKRLVAECKNLCGLTPGQVQKLKDWMKEQGMTIPTKKDKKSGLEKETLGAEVLKKFAADPETPELVRKVIKIRQDFSTTSLAKLDAAVNFADELHIVRGQFLYHGATTGRWTGKGVQFQNMPRGTFNEDTVRDDMVYCCDAVGEQDLDYIENWYSDVATPMGVMKSCLRGMVIPRDGRILRVMDFSQIEARVLPWLAGQQDVLDAFVEGKDLYKYTASQIYNKPYDDIDKSERFIGKTASLALGYQGGAGAFTSMALNFGVIVERKNADQIKKDWRARNQHIVKFWYDLEKAAIHTVTTGKGTRVHGKITFRMQDEYLTMVLPSGRSLWYYQPRVKQRAVEIDGKIVSRKMGLSYMGSDSVRNIKWGRIHTYGGKLAENATQAASRCLLVDAMHKLDNYGYNLIIHVHDELVTEDKPSFGSMDEMHRIMTDAPEWAEGLPIEAEGFECVRYHKA